MSARRHELSLWLALSGMEVSWLCAWAAFICSALGLPVCSPSQAFAVYALAAGVSLQPGSRFWRGSLHFVGLAGALSSSLSAVLRASGEALLPLAWVMRAVERPLVSLVVCGFAGVLWLRGALDVRRERSYLVTCARFDRSMFAMLGLLLFQLLLRKHLTQPNALPGLLGAPLLACGVCALALARNRHAGRKGFVGGFRGAGTLLSLLGGLLFAAAVGGVVLWPALHDASEAGYGGLYRVVRPVARAYADVVLYIMRLAREQSQPPELALLERPAQKRKSIGSADPLHEPVLNLELGTWSLLGVALGVLFALWLARRWLLARRSEQRASWLEWLLQWLRELWSRLQRPDARASEPLRLYLGLVRWGRQSGAAKRGSETPQEYAARLSHLSGLQADIEPIVSAFHAHAYGAKVSPAALHAARRALSRLRAPRHWAIRFRLWLVRRPQDDT